MIDCNSSTILTAEKMQAKIDTWADTYNFWQIPKLWENETAVIVASGPSLKQWQIDYVKDKDARLLVINNNYLLALWADCHYFCDPKWYHWHKDDLEWDQFKGIRVTMQSVSEILPFHTVCNAGETGLCKEKDGLATGRNSGYQAVNLAYHFGVKRIILIGYDTKPGPNGEVHWFGQHPVELAISEIHKWKSYWDSIADDLDKENIEVINCTLDTALDCFQKADIRDIL